MRLLRNLSSRIALRSTGGIIGDGGALRDVNNVTKDANMTLTFSAGPVIALIAGILILIMPRLLNYIVAIYLIVIGLLGLFGSHMHV
jgi:hypothetical protein